MDFIKENFEILALVLLLAIVALLITVLVMQLSKQALAKQLKKAVKDLKDEGQDMLDDSQEAILKEISDEAWKNEKRSGDLKDALGDVKTELKGAIGEFKTELKGAMGEFKTEQVQAVGGLKEDLLKNHADEQQKLFDNLNQQSKNVTEQVATALKGMQEVNEGELEKMRQTVDEKLSQTLKDRLEGSFKQVSDQLINVYQSLTEMKKLGDGVTDLQRVLTNVKTRGTWAEVQLGNLLEQTLTENQYERNVSPRNNSERVEYAIKIPSRQDDNSFVWLPIDSKFPQEDYLRIVEAADNADREAMDAAVKQLERSIKGFAKDISKYLEVPKTTDFAIMFLPTEGLYAEVLRCPGLVEEVQTKSHVMICGPTTITAFLNTLRVGFRTIAMDKQASEVWKLLEATKAQYENFNNLLGKAKKKIDEAGAAIESAQSRSGIIHKKLKGVEALSSSDADSVLGISVDSLLDESVDGD